VAPLRLACTTLCPIPEARATTLPAPTRARDPPQTVLHDRLIDSHGRPRTHCQSRDRAVRLPKAIAHTRADTRKLDPHHNIHPSSLPLNHNINNHSRSKLSSNRNRNRIRAIVHPLSRYSCRTRCGARQQAEVQEVEAEDTGTA
jgi:hypothetical protein